MLHLRHEADGEDAQPRKVKWRTLEKRLTRYLFLCTGGVNCVPFM